MIRLGEYKKKKGEQRAKKLLAFRFVIPVKIDIDVNSRNHGIKTLESSLSLYCEGYHRR